MDSGAPKISKNQIDFTIEFVGRAGNALKFRMRAILSAIASMLLFRFRSRASLELEVLALRHQLKVLRRNRGRKPVPLKRSDRSFWRWLYRLWPRSIDWMVLVRPESVVRWHREGFIRYWRWRSNEYRRWKVKDNVRELIRRMDRENPLWGVRRIQGELLKLGYDISTTWICKILRRSARPPSPTWRVFLRNHMPETAAVDMFVVFTLAFRFLYTMVVISHERRRIIHFAVTERPTQDWVTEEISRAFSSTQKPKFLIRDRDPLYGMRYRSRLHTMKIQDCVIPRQYPWHNIYVERLILSIRRECLDHVVIFNRNHLRRILSSYIRYYNQSRTHASLAQDCPEPRAVQPPSTGENIVAIPQIGGLHHRYERRAA
jgi:hypothetical protein